MIPLELVRGGWCEGWPQWMYYPPRSRPPAWVPEFIAAVAAVRERLDSADVYALTSDVVLSHLAPGLTALGYNIEARDRDDDWICRPVLFGPQGTQRVAFQVDGIHDGLGIVVDIEAGRGAPNNAVYRNLIRASLIVDARFLALGVIAGDRHMTGRPEMHMEGFAEAAALLDFVYASGRLVLPLEGMLLFGY